MREMDIGMRQRAAEEIRKLGANPYQIARAIGCDRSLVRYWLSEAGVPSHVYLKRIHECGGDALYIITGERKDGGGNE